MPVLNDIILVSLCDERRKRGCWEEKWCEGRSSRELPKLAFFHTCAEVQDETSADACLSVLPQVVVIKLAQGINEDALGM